MSGCGIKPKPLPDVDLDIDERDKPPTSVEEAYKSAWYRWEEDSKTEKTYGKRIDVPYRINGRVIGRVNLRLQKVNKEYQLYYLVVGETSCWSRRGCYDGVKYSNFNFYNCIDKNAGALIKKSKELSTFIWLITEEQIKIMSTRGADLSMKYEFYEGGNTRGIPGSGYMEVQVPVIYVQGFLRKVNELHNKTK